MSKHGPDNHGNTVAAWTCVGILILAAFILSLALVLTSKLLLVFGLVTFVVGLVAGKVLSLAGYGSVQPADAQVTRADR